MDKVQELEARVGNREQPYCGQQKKQTLHLWIREVRKRWAGANNKAYLLKCTECGYTEEVYCTDYL